MPAFTLTPNAPGTYAVWSVSAGTTWAALAAVGDPYIYRNGSALDYSNAALSDLPADAGAIDGLVTHYSRVRLEAGSGGATVYPTIRYAGANYEGTVINPPANDAYAYYSRTYANLGGTAFTPLILNACEAGVYGNESTGFRVDVDYVVLTGNYSPAAGGFAFLIASVIPFLLGANLLLSDLPGIAREVASRRHLDGGAFCRILPAEYARAYRELREAKHPTFFLPRAA